MLAAILSLAAVAQAAQEPIHLHPENPRYFEFRGEPAFLITSGEHYGAVLNVDFDHGPYLDELQRRGFNQTRTFSGTYREIPESFNIRDNTLAPKAGRYQSPWVMEDGKFDLDRLDPAYFERLRSFVAAAGERGIVVEYVLFCPFYGEELWRVNPMNAANNVNGVGDCPREEVYTLKHPELLKRQLAFVDRAVRELNGFDNVYFEVCNEPYFGGVTLDWQRRVVEAILAAEKDLPRRHLIAQNIANGAARVEDPHPAVSIFNFHYATPPTVVAMNTHLNRAIADDETGFRGHDDRIYRAEAWEFFLAGGSAYSNLDYSFTPDREDGTAPVTDPTPGGGGPSLRAQLAILKGFLGGFDFLRMQPDESVIAVRGAAEGAKAWALAEPGEQYAAYVRGGSGLVLRLDLPAGRYQTTWIDPRDGRELKAETITAASGATELEAPDFAEDVALKLVAAGP